MNMRRTAFQLLAVWLCAGCGLLLENPAPKEARLVIDGEVGQSIRLTTSTSFVAAVNELGETRVELFVSDTVTVTLPYEKVYDIDKDHRYFAEAAWLDNDLENVRMQVYVDDRKQFDESGTLVQDHPYRFVYSFNQVVTRDIQVL